MKIIESKHYMAQCLIPTSKTNKTGLFKLEGILKGFLVGYICVLSDLSEIEGIASDFTCT